MQIFHRLRRLAASLPLLALACALPQAGAAQRTQAANVVPLYSLGASGVESSPSGQRGDLLLGNDGNIYMVSSVGGTGGLGSIARLGTDDKLAVVYAFTDADQGYSSYARLTQGSDGNLYGTTYLGGANGAGTVFRVTLAGAFTLLYSFDDEKVEPKLPYTGLLQGPDGFLYGTTLRGGAQDKGTVFRLATDGSAFTKLYEFDGANGENPEGTLVLGPDGALYGTTLQGGEDNRGVIYKITTTGTFTRVFSFPALSEFNTAGLATNTVGANPRAGLMLSTDGNFYGTAYQGGAAGYGTLFRVTPAGVLTVVHAFAGPSYGGGFPLSGVVQDTAGNFYGTTERGGYLNRGSAYRVDAAGQYTLLHGFTGSLVEGAQPYAGLLLARNSIYAASFSDSFAGAGALVKLDTGTGGVLPVELSVSATDIAAGSSVAFTWSGPAGSTCSKLGTWSGATTVTGTESVTPASAGIYTYGIGCTDTASLVHNAYIAVTVRAPATEAVDGGASGGGAVSLWLLALLAALLTRKYFKETGSTCP
ncbi:MAG: choice-of-anchor tandem repeat GloVer-containing protein [Steroidobacteraceae bacterium]